MKPSKEFVDKVTAELTDQGLLVEAGWVGYKLCVLPEEASDVQISETRFAFFAGAQHLFSSIMAVLDPGDIEPTQRDLERMSKIHDELKRFEIQLRKAAN